ncbi:MAG: phosphate/phosphite/phosphonate ABC transporter substrate-binding protein, partial [Pseudomonadota bacterium]
PQFTNTAIHHDWIPILKEIEKRTGHTFTLQRYESFNEFEAGFLEGKSDFSYMNPFHIVMAKGAQNYTSLIRDDKSRLTGIITSRKGSSIQTLSDLQGQKIAFAAPNAFAASLYMQSLLKNKEQIDFTPVYAGTHSNAYRQVLTGQAKAAGGVYRTLNKEPPEVQAALQVIYKTPSTPTHAIVAHPKVSTKIQKEVQQAILEFAQTEKNQNLLNAILIPRPVIASYQQDYQVLEQLNLAPFLGRY